MQSEYIILTQRNSIQYKDILDIISVFVGDELYINKYSKTHKCYTIHNMYLKSIHRDEGLWLPELV